MVTNRPEKSESQKKIDLKTNRTKFNQIVNIKKNNRMTTMVYNSHFFFNIQHLQYSQHGRKQSHLILCSHMIRKIGKAGVKKKQNVLRFCKILESFSMFSLKYSHFNENHSHLILFLFYLFKIFVLGKEIEKKKGKKKRIRIQWSSTY